jgi:hypothetical protein
MNKVAVSMWSASVFSVIAYASKNMPPDSFVAFLIVLVMSLAFALLQRVTSSWTR